MCLILRLGDDYYMRIFYPWGKKGLVSTYDLYRLLLFYFPVLQEAKSGHTVRTGQTCRPAGRRQYNARFIRVGREERRESERARYFGAHKLRRGFDYRDTGSLIVDR